MRLLVVDDERRLASALKHGLSREGYVVDLAHDGGSALDAAMAGSYDAIILDLMLPVLSGYEVVRRLRAAQVWTPVLMLTAKDGEYDEADALDEGADDYLTKPFSLAELLARVRVRLRDVAHPLGEVLRAGELLLDFGRLEANIGQGPVPLTRLEFLLLRELMEHAGQSVTKGQLLASVWGYDFDPGSNVVDVCVRRIRSKLGFDLIKTVRGEGYQLTS